MTPEARTEYIVACIRKGAAMYPEDAEKLLAEHDAHRRAEVLAEAADRIDRTPSISAAVHATTELRRMAAEGAAGKDTLGGDQPPAGESTQPAPDFFQPGHTYQRRRWLFQCLATAPTPFNGERRAVGFLYRPGEPATATALDPDDWEQGNWTDTAEAGEAL